MELGKQLESGLEMRFMHQDANSIWSTILSLMNELFDAGKLIESSVAHYSEPMEMMVGT